MDRVTSMATWVILCNREPTVWDITFASGAFEIDTEHYVEYHLP